MEVWKECMRWKSDDKELSEDAIVEVSNHGNVRKLKQKRWNEKNNGYSIYKERLYVPNSNRGKQRKEVNVDKKYGKYLSVNINGKTFSVHRLVAIAFIPNPDNKPQVNHIDENRSNNSSNNLEWCTNKENHNAKSYKKKQEFRNKMRKLSDDIAKRCLRLRLDGNSCHTLAKMFDVSHETIRIETLAFATEEDLIILKQTSKKLARDNRLKTMYEKGAINEYSIYT